MKKLRSNSKRKWIVGGVMFFGGIGLLTTGFATWVVGTQVLNQKDNIGITVDTAKNDSITIKAVLHDGEAFYLGEAEAVSKGGDDVVHVQNGSAADFTVVFDSVSIQCGNEYYNNHFNGDTAFTLQLATNDAADADSGKNVLAANKIGDAANLVDKAGTTSHIREGSEFTYINLDAKTESITPSKGVAGAWEVNDGIHSITLTDLTYTFGWGTFFGGKAPSEFYNTNGATIKPELLKINAVEKELTAMRTALNVSQGYIPFILTLAPGK